MGPSIIHKYFPYLTNIQKERFEALGRLYGEWNAKINVISRKDIDKLHERHVLHSLGIAKIISFSEGNEILDVGTGGGFPGIPLAILFPESAFTLVDSIGKKIKVVNEIANALELENIHPIHARVESIDHSFDYIVSRAVTRMEEFMKLCGNKIKRNSSSSERKNGILALKGGDLKDELLAVKKPYSIHSLHDYFKEEFFTTKYVVHVSI